MDKKAVMMVLMKGLVDAELLPQELFDRITANREEGEALQAEFTTLLENVGKEE